MGGSTSKEEEEKAAKAKEELEKAKEVERATAEKLKAEREETRRLQRLIDQQNEKMKEQQIQSDRLKAQQIQDEQITSELCPNARFGCKSPVPYEDLLAHSKACLYRYYKCPIQSCSWQGNYSELYSHAEEVHTACTGMYFGQHSRVLLGPDMMLLTIRGLVFKFYARPTEHRLSMCWVVQLLGPPTEAANWKYEVQISKAGDRVKRIQLSDMCLHEDEDIDKVLKEGRCPSAAFKMLGNYLQKNRVGFKLNIFNKSQLQQSKSDIVT